MKFTKVEQTRVFLVFGASLKIKKSSLEFRFETPEDSNNSSGTLHIQVTNNNKMKSLILSRLNSILIIIIVHWSVWIQKPHSFAKNVRNARNGHSNNNSNGISLINS